MEDGNTDNRVRQVMNKEEGEWKGKDIGLIGARSKIVVINNGLLLK